MSSPRPHDAWSALPSPLRSLLVHGSTGREHLLEVSRLALRLAVGDAGAAVDRARCSGLVLLAQDALLAAWAQSPLDGSLAAPLLNAQLLTAPLRARPLRGWPSLPAPVVELAQAQAHFWQPPAEGAPWWTATGLGARLDLAAARHKDEPRNLFWKHAAWTLAWPLADWALAESLLDEGGWPRSLAPLRHRFGAQVQFARGDVHAALASLNAIPAILGDDAGLRASCLLALGQRQEALEALRRSVTASPWSTGDWLRLHDLAADRDRAVAPLPGGVCILLYTYNKARELDETLTSLAASATGDAPVWVLDNGSTDNTASVLDAWCERLGGRLRPLRLPVNIGAPAARNWLLALPEVRRHEYLVFLDDDVSLPPDWLARLGAAVAAYPQASVWGCRVVDEANPLVAQSVDISPAPTQPGGQALLLPGLHGAQPDLGRFDYLRPCVSVTGCCHLLREADISTTGGFDIRFSPSQYDDFERDLRLCLAGGHAVYQGHLRVLHKRRSGSAAERSPAEMGNATANTHKLLTKHGAEDLQRVQARGEALLEGDLVAKLRALAGQD